jgi:hypothetical protein
VSGFIPVMTSTKLVLDALCTSERHPYAEVVPNCAYPTKLLETSALIRALECETLSALTLVIAGWP